MLLPVLLVLNHGGSPSSIARNCPSDYMRNHFRYLRCDLNGSFVICYGYHHDEPDGQGEFTAQDSLSVSRATSAGTASFRPLAKHRDEQPLAIACEGLHLGGTEVSGRLASLFLRERPKHWL